MNNEELLNENAELKAKIIKYAAINEQETKDYAELKAENETYKANADAVQKCITQNEQLKTYISGLEKKNAKLNAIIDGYQPKIQALKDENERLKEKIKVLQYNMVEYSNNNIDTAVTLFAKDKAKLEKENALLKAHKDKYYQQTLDDEIKLNELYQTLQEIKEIAEPFAKCYTHTCRNCEKYDSAHACCLKDINCYEYNDGSKSSCKDFVLPTKQFYQQILANVITRITKAEEE